MSISGAYTLLLSCDYPGCKELKLQIVRASRILAMEVASQAGWKMFFNGECYCEAHREESKARRTA